MMKITKAVIPAAGFGTRFLPATKAMPKEMLPIIDTPTLQYIVKEAVDSGITDILIIIGKNKKCIEDHFDRSVELEDLLVKGGKSRELKMVRDIADMAHIYYVRQKEMNGSGNAILEAEAFVGNEPFAVMFGDDLIYNESKPCLKQLIDAYETTGKSIVGVQEVPREEAPKYGIIVPGRTKGRYTEMNGIVEKPSIDELPSTYAGLGRYILKPEIFDIIKRSKPHANGEVYITDAILETIDIDGVYAYDFEGRRYDIGDKEGYLEATVEYALRDEKLREGFVKYLKGLKI
ncbi:MAG: UTP--glucose-1-phosphate uridylyltransferase GalU [Clostridia bacterium]|nr:UTP--glucose-1-phosphate uridylyltransferase GalU [Clostridia bacterium]